MEKEVTSGGNGTYYVPKSGAFVYQKLDPENLGFEPSDPPKGVRYRKWEMKDGSKGSQWEKFYSSLTGKIESLEIQTSPWGDKVLVIQMEDSPEEYIQIPILNKHGMKPYGKAFIQRIPGIDPSKPITLRAYKIEREDKPGSYNEGIAVDQDGSTISSTFTAKDPNGCPPPEETVDDVTGDKSWDFRKHNKFLWDKLNEFIDSVAKAKLDEPAEESDEPTDDLPF